VNPPSLFLESDTLNKILLVIVCCFVILVARADPSDKAGSKDSPLVSRFPGSVIDDYSSSAFDEFKLPTGPVDRDVQDDPKNTVIEGKVTRFSYTIPAGHTPVEIYKSYTTAMKQAGFETIYACNGEACGLSRFFPTTGWDETWYGNGYQWSGKLTRPTGDVYVNLHVENATNLDIIETKPMTAGLVTVNASALQGDIGKSGHVAIYGVYFDTGKAEIKPESASALQEISKLLLQNPTLKLYVVGHTDNTGELQANLELSRRRADAVVKALSTTYAIAPDRLAAFGAGPYAPVASNKMEDGKTKNRRVELVER
jgi:outer membrane protein OmpA-like peptidoglycan-associated protein